MDCRGEEMEDSFIKLAVRLLKECEKSLEDHFRGGPRSKVAEGVSPGP